MNKIRNISHLSCILLFFVHGSTVQIYEDTFFNVALFSLVAGEEREGNLSLERSFMPNSSLILLKTNSDRNVLLMLLPGGIPVEPIHAPPACLLGLLHVVVKRIVLHLCICQSVGGELVLDAAWGGGDRFALHESESKLILCHCCKQTVQNYYNHFQPHHRYDVSSRTTATVYRVRLSPKSWCK